MNLARNPELVDHLAAAYALGTLRGGARRRFETLARQDATLRASALMWQARWALLTELQPDVAPSPNVWLRIESTIAQPPRAAPAQSDGALLRRLQSMLSRWRFAALAGGLGLLASLLMSAVLHGELSQLRTRLAATPEIRYVAVLVDSQAAASMLVTFDPRGQRLVLRRVGSYHEAADKSLQLWALPTAGAPRSLGVIGGESVIQLPAPEGAVAAVPALAISLEPRGGVPGEGGPTGPVLFKGELLKTGI